MNSYLNCKLFKIIEGIFFLFFFPFLYSQNPTLLKDINQSKGGSYYYEGFVEYNGKVFFGAYDSENGEEVYISVGKNEGTTLLKNIETRPGLGCSPRFFTVCNGLLYFIAKDSFSGHELWVTDGTNLGTRMVKDINPGSKGSSPSWLTAHNNKLYFNADDGIHGNEFWVTDGTDTGTHLIKDIFIGPIGTFFSIKSINGLLYMNATDGINGYSLWVSDGTEAGTKLIKVTSVIGEMVSYKDKVYFSGFDPIHGRELWATDGTTIGTVLVCDLDTISSHSGDPQNFYIFKDKLFFTANDSINGRELWVTDGTISGTIMVKDFNKTLENYSSSNPNHFNVLQGRMYFTVNQFHSFVNSSMNSQSQLWSTSDGIEFRREFDNSGYQNIEPGPIMVYNEKIYFVASRFDGNFFVNSLYSYDGVNEINELSIDSNPGLCYSCIYSKELYLCNGSIYFWADFTNSGVEPYFLTTSIKKVPFLSSNEILIYPNPTSSNYNVKVGSNIGSFALIDKSGKILFEQNVNSTNVRQFYTSELSNGQYFLRFRNFSGDIIETKKLLVQH